MKATSSGEIRDSVFGKSGAEIVSVSARRKKSGKLETFGTATTSWEESGNRQEQDFNRDKVLRRYSLYLQINEVGDLARFRLRKKRKVI